MWFNSWIFWSENLFHIYLLLNWAFERVMSCLFFFRITKIENVPIQSIHGNHLPKQSPRGVDKKRCSDILKMCSKFTGEHRCWSVITIKLQSNSIEITLRHRCSPVNLLHIFRTPFPRNTSAWFLLVL